MNNENKTKRITLSEKEAIILRDLYFAKTSVMHAGDEKAADAVPLRQELTETEVRKVLPVFNFFRSAYTENEEAIKRQAGDNYYDGMIKYYHACMNGFMDRNSAKDIITLNYRLKAFVKTQKAQPARMLYISDCHFFDNNINFEMDCRGFSGFEEMNEHMIEQWNRKVTKKDDVYILGDFSIAKADTTEKLLKRLNGKLHLIIGNHDRFLRDKTFDRSLFRSIDPYLEIGDQGKRVILSHFPVFCYNGQYRRDKDRNPLNYMLYGHVHNTHDEDLVNQFIRMTRQTKALSRHAEKPEPIPCNMINCFCMFSNYQPMTLKEWIAIDQKRREMMRD